MDRKFVESLGWVYEGLWSNQEFYTYNNYQILEDCGDWYISTEDDMYAIEGVSEKMLTEFTNLLKSYYEVVNDPENHTLAEHFKVMKGINSFFKEYGYNEEEEFENL